MFVHDGLGRPTYLPAKILDASRVAKTYFERWPLQELCFGMPRHLALCIASPGMAKSFSTTKPCAPSKKMQEKIAALRNRLQQAIAQLSVLDQQLHTWIEKERQLRVQSRIVDGQRQMNPRQAQKRDEYRCALAAIEREKRRVRQPDQKLFNRLKRHEQEWLRLQGFVAPNFLFACHDRADYGTAASSSQAQSQGQNDDGSFGTGPPEAQRAKLASR
jgi:hypothetical protein